MIEIEFSVLVANREDADRLRPLLDAFEKQKHVKVKITPILWSEGWSEIANIAIYGHGPDVSEVGTTWISSVAALNALRPFSADEIRSLGGASAFLTASWRTGIRIGGNRVWAIPWLIHSALLYYRKDWLEQAGISDAGAAFADATALEQTLQRLYDNGIPHPLSLTTHRLATAIHEAATWIWNAGGDFLSADGKQVLFNQPEAMRGLHAFFSLRRFIAPPTTPPRTPVDHFLNGDTAVALGSPWIVFHHQELPLAKHIGVAPLPGVAFIGGTSLVIWTHSPETTAALELVRFLNSQPYRPASLHQSLFPAHQEALNAFAAQDTLYRNALAALLKGRSFPAVRLWGSIESRLIDALTTTWAEVLADPASNIDRSLQRHIDPVAQWLNRTLPSRF
ncbi:MAG TPA: extracellular solute-binding protein [Anaerolineae bacterium]